MPASCVPPPVSAKPHGDATPSSNALTRKEAIWARVTVRVGQNLNGPVSQPWSPRDLPADRVRRPPHAVVHIGEATGRLRGRGSAAADPHQPHRHFPAQQRILGTQTAPILTARTIEKPGIKPSQSVNGRLVNTPSSTGGASPPADAYAGTGTPTDITTAKRADSTTGIRQDGTSLLVIQATPPSTGALHAVARKPGQI